MFLLGIRENIYFVKFFGTQQLHFWITLKANALYFCVFLEETFCSKDVVTFYLMGVGWGKGK